MERALLTRNRVDADAENISKRFPNISREEIKMVLEAVIEERQNHKRRHKPPPPEGGISLSAASRKYGISSPTLSRWVQKGYIPVILRTKNELYADESKLAALVKIYKASPGQGKNTVSQKMSDET